MGATETISDKRIRKTAKEAGKEAAREAFLDMTIGGDETEGLPLDTLDGNSDEALGEAAAGFDIFQDVGKALSEKGEVLKYIIKREGERVGSKYHPYSWERLAKDYGPGHYQVIARSESRNRFIRSQTQIIGDVGAFEDPSEDSSSNDTQAKVTQPIGWQQPQMGFLEMFNLMQSQSDRARQEATQTATQQAQSQVAMITAMTEMMKNAQLQSQQMFMEMTKMNAQMAEKMAQAQEKIVEKINQRMDKLADVATKKPEGPSWIDVMKMNNDSQNKGFELFEKIMKLAELKAEEKVELIESARDVGGGEEKKKSMTDTLIESLLPVIATSMAASQQRQLVQAPQALPPQIPQQTLPRRALRPPTNPVPQANGAVQRGQGTPQRVVKAPSQKGAASEKRADKPIVVGGGASVGPSIVIAKPKAETSSPLAQSPVKVTETLADKVEVIETPALQTEARDIKEEVKAHCKEILPVFLGGLMLEATEIPEAGTKTIEFLKEHGISRELFLKNVEAKDLIDVAVEYELPKEAHQWLNDLYAYIQSQPRNDARRKSPAGKEHEVTDRG